MAETDIFRCFHFQKSAAKINKLVNDNISRKFLTHALIPNIRYSYIPNISYASYP